MDGGREIRGQERRGEHGVELEPSQIGIYVERPGMSQSDACGMHLHHLNQYTNGSIKKNSAVWVQN